MARVLPIHDFVMTRDKKHTAVAAVAAAAAAGDVNVKKTEKYCLDMLKFNSYIFRVLKEVDPDSSISSEALEVMNGIISNMMLKLIHKSFKNSLRRRKISKLSVKDISAAVLEVFPPQMAKLARQAARKARTTRTVNRLSAKMDQTMSMKY